MRNGECRAVVVKVRYALPDSKGLIQCNVGRYNTLLPAVEVEAGELVDGTHKYLVRNRRLKLQQAIDLAVVAHAKQGDMYDNSPYVRYLFRVMESVAEHGEAAMIVAVLRSIVRYTWVTFEYLKELGATQEILDAIDSVTERVDETYEELLLRARANRLGRLVELASVADCSDESRLALLPPAEAQELRTTYAVAQSILS